MSGRTPDRPVDRPVAKQTWSDVTFLHWRADPAAVQTYLPAGLQVNVLDGTAWLGVVPFVMSRVRAGGLPPIPGWSRFPELNVRTYVRGPDGEDGVHFFRLLCPRRAFVWALRALGLPYVHSRADAVREGRDRYLYRFRLPGDTRERPLFGLRIEAGPPLAAGDRTPLVNSLTGRWNAYAQRAGRLLRVPVEHEPWPLHAAEVVRGRWSPTVAGLPQPLGKPLVHFSPGVSSRFGMPTPV